MKTIEVFVVVNFEVASSSCLRDVKNKYFVTAPAEAAADIDDGIKRKRFRVWLNKLVGFSIIIYFYSLTEWVILSYYCITVISLNSRCHHGHR